MLSGNESLAILQFVAFYGASYRVLAWLTTSLKVLPREYFSESNYWQLAPDGKLQLKAVGCVLCCRKFMLP